MISKSLGVSDATHQQDHRAVPSESCAVVIHLYYEDQWPEFNAVLSHVEHPFTLFVTLMADSTFGDEIRKSYPEAIVLAVPNIGRDVAPFLNLLPRLADFDLVCKLHTKRSEGRHTLWRRSLVEGLLGSRGTVRAYRKAFADDPDLVIAGPRDFYLDGTAHELACKKALTLQHGPLPESYGFFAGTMFWCRPSAFAELADLYPQTCFVAHADADGQPEHVVERAFGCLAAVRNKKIMLWDGFAEVAKAGDFRGHTDFFNIYSRGTEEVDGDVLVNPKVDETGQTTVPQRGLGHIHVRPPTNLYEAWLSVNEPSEAEERRLRAALTAAADRAPLISLIMPVFRPPLDLLEKAVESVLSQIYDNWELCIHVDGDDDPVLDKWLRGLARCEPRVKLSISKANGGISIGTNAAAELATGELLAFFDQDDLLTKTALAHIALAALDNPEADLLYSDDDKIDVADSRYAPQFKPGWAPVLLLSYMYMSHILVVRWSLFMELGGFRLGFEGSQDYDFALRAAENAREVIHIPHILYHWRAAPGSTATSGDAKPNSFLAGLRSVQEACGRRGISAKVYQPDWAVQGKLGVFGLSFPHTGPQVTIVIPTRNRLDLLKPCIDSIKRLTLYKNYDILIVDNQSDDPATLAYLASCGHKVIRVASVTTKFNFSYLMNRAVEAATGEFVLLLNNDTIVRNNIWLSQMVGYGQMSGVGAVGAKLYFPDETLQHAGIVHGLHSDLAGHAFRNEQGGRHGYLDYTKVAREYSAVTAACLLSKREVYLSNGGMDEENFAVAYNDVDYCYRLVSAGYTCIYCPDAELTHFEGKSRGFKDSPLEEASFRKKYRRFRDKWYNPNLSLDDESFRLRPKRYVAPALAKQPPRTTFVSHNLNHEGAPNVLFELVTGLKDRMHVDPLVASPIDGPLRADYEAAGIPVRIVKHPLAGGSDPTSYAVGRDDFAEELLQFRTEVLFANTAETFWALDVASKAELPTIWNIHESEPWDDYFKDLPDFVQAHAYDAFYSAYRVAFVALSTRDLWSPLAGRHNFSVMHHGLDIARLEKRLAGNNRLNARQQLGIADDEVALVVIGTVCERKNQHILLEAIGQMQRSIARRLKVFIVGDRQSPYSQRLHHAWSELPVEIRERVEIVPETNEPYVYIIAGDVYVCSSLRESYPRVILEAMALGLPLVTTPVFGIVEQVRPEVNGLFFSPDNSLELMEVLERIVEDDALRKRFGENSKTLFEGLIQYDDMLERYGATIQEAALSAGYRVGAGRRDF